MSTGIELVIPVGNPSGGNTPAPSFDYDSTSSIPWSDFETMLDAKFFSTGVVGAQVVDTNEHSWRIIKAGEDYYDLWYEETIGNKVFNSSYNSQSYCYWSQSQLRTNLNGSLFYTNTAKLPTAMKDHVIDKEVNAAWIKYQSSKYQAGGTNKSTDKVWLLTYTEIAGHSVSPNSSYDTPVTNSGNDGEEYDYFKQGIAKRSSTGNSGLVRGTYSYMWLATGYWNAYYSDANALGVNANGSFSGNYASNSYGVVPAIRVQ